MILRGCSFLRCALPIRTRSDTFCMPVHLMTSSLMVQLWHLGHSHSCQRSSGLLDRLDAQTPPHLTSARCEKYPDNRPNKT